MKSIEANVGRLEQDAASARSTIEAIKKEAGALQLGIDRLNEEMEKRREIINSDTTTITSEYNANLIQLQRKTDLAEDITRIERKRDQLERQAQRIEEQHKASNEDLKASKAALDNSKASTLIS